ncbi:extracellular solute-binding protein [bacterium]|nr:extracellular solute-binding protein [bacterium]
MFENSEDPNSKNKIIIISAITLVILGIIVTVFLMLSKKVTVGAGNITLTYWGFDEKKPIQTIADNFKGKSKNVKVEYTQKGSTPEEYQKILDEAIASGEGPDLFQIRNDWLPMNYKKMATMPKDVYTVDEYKKLFYPVAFQDLSKGEDIYAIPFYIDTLVLYANKTILESKALNSIAGGWNEFNKYSKFLRKTTNGIEIAGTSLGTADNISYSPDLLYMLMLQNQATMTSPDNKTAYFNLSLKDRYNNITYPSANALGYYTSFATPGNDNYTWNNSMPAALNAFIDGKTALYFGYASDRKIIESATNKSLQYMIFNAPQQTGNISYFAKYWATGVSKNSKNQSDAWSFIKYVTKDEIMPTYGSLTNLPLARKDLNANLQFAGNYMDVFISQLPKATSWNKGNWEETDKAFKESINNVLLGKETPQQAMDSCATKVTKILEEVN